MLAIDVLVSVIGAIKDITCLIVVLTSAVNLKLNAKSADAIAIKDRVWLVVVAMNDTVLLPANMTVIAILAVLVLIAICIALANQRIAVIAVRVIIIVAAVAKCSIPVACIAGFEDASPTAVAGYSFVVITLRTKDLPRDLKSILGADSA